MLVFRGNGDGTFDSGTRYSISRAVPRAVALGELDGDGILDLVVANSTYSSTVFLGKEDGIFASPTSYGSGDAQSVSLGDVDGDGDLDLVAGGDQVLLLLNRRIR